MRRSGIAVDVLQRHLMRLRQEHNNSTTVLGGGGGGGGAGSIGGGSAAHAHISRSPHGSTRSRVGRNRSNNGSVTLIGNGGIGTVQ